MYVILNYRAYFGNGSIEYNMIRVPMGSSDFSPRPYSYAETENDIFLEKFSLADEDIKYKVRDLIKTILLFGII